jgi:hypothetical protein
MLRLGQPTFISTVALYNKSDRLQKRLEEQYILDKPLAFGPYWFQRKVVPYEKFRLCF